MQRVCSRPETKCKRCGSLFLPRQWNQVFCGSKIKKEGCSWTNVNQVRNKRRWQNPAYKEYQKKYGREWRRQQRIQGSEYALRQLLAKREYYHSGKGKEGNKRWRRENVDKILFWNKKRILKKKNVQGSHSWQEWEEVKRLYKNCCVLCGISEKEIEKKWAGTHFSKLTEDHIIPIARGGTDNIDNIQPLCISCNAKKGDKE